MNIPEMSTDLGTFPAFTHFIIQPMLANSNQEYTEFDHLVVKEKQLEQRLNSLSG